MNIEDNGVRNMRVDNSNLIEITKSNSSVEVKGNVSVQTQKTTTQQIDKTTGEVRSVQQTTVDKPFFAGDSESELDKIRQDAENMEVKLYKKQMETVTNTATADDCAKMDEDGSPLNSTEVKAVVTEMDKIKMQLAKAGVDISIFGDDLSMEQLAEMLGSAGMAYQMEQAITAADLPATEENISDCQETLKQAADLTECNEQTVKYMVENELSPTVENLYKAQHSTTATTTIPMQQTAEAGAKQESAVDENFQKQIEQVVKEAGLEVNETTLGYSQWMLDNNIPLTPENLKYAADLFEMEFPLDVAAVIDGMMTAISEGNRPKDAIVVDGYSMAERAQQTADVIDNVTDADVWTVVEKGQQVTVENLAAAHNSNAVSENGSEGDSNGKEIQSTEVPAYAQEDIKYITARRQLEEIRLMMTTEANYALLKKGINIDTKPLEELVEQLKDLENDYYKNLLSNNGIEPTKENTELFAETVEKAEELKSVPAYVLGTDTVENHTVNTLHEAGTQLKNELQKAGEAYETLMTAPRADMGDSIQKAFRNVDDILEDLGMETTEANQRAVRILAYNQLDITADSINQMKAADQKVQVLFQNLSPSVVMEMIREGINPMEMDISQLNAKAEEIKNQIDAGGEEKFSKYLWKMEQKNEITPEERDSYIGIYRLLNQIDKTDGAVIGAVLNQGAELSMKNLLTAVRTNRGHGVDTTVDDNLGATVTEKTPDLSISQQIEAAYQTDCAKEAFARMTPEGMEQAQQQGAVDEMTPEELLWQLKNTQVDQESEEAYYKQQLEEFAQARGAEEQVLKLLTGYDMPVTAYNVLAANQMLHNRNGIFKTLFEYSNEEETDIDLEEVKQGILEDFAEAVKTPEDMAKAQKKLADVAENVMKTMAQATDVQSFDIRDLKIMRQEIELGNKMAKEENYAIPVLVADEYTNIQLKIVRGTDKRGRLDVIFDSPKLGKVAARFQVQGEKIKGYIASDSNDTIENLKEQQDQLSEKLSMEGTLYPNLDLIQSDNLDLTQISLDSRTYGDISGQSEEEYQVQTKVLYGMAKEFIEAVKQLGIEV